MRCSPAQLPGHEGLELDHTGGGHKATGRDRPVGVMESAAARDPPIRNSGRGRDLVAVSVVEHTHRLQ